MARIPRRPMAIVRLRALFGLGFAAFGVVLAVKIGFFTPAPLDKKLLGLGFAVVLFALGLVRVREYLLARRAAQAGP